MRGRLFAGLALASLAALAMPAAAQAQAKAASKRPMVAVTDFDFGTVGNHWWGDYDIGKGVADQIMDQLLEDGSFRVIERKKLDTVLAEQDFAHSDRADPSAAKLSKLGKVLGVKYIITGSITKYGGEQNDKGGSLRGVHVGVGKAKTEVGLTARMIDTTTGEVLLSAKGIGVSKKGGGMSFGKSGMGSFGKNTSDFKESAIGEAQEAACKELVTAIVAKKDRLE